MVKYIARLLNTGVSDRMKPVREIATRFIVFGILAYSRHIEYQANIVPSGKNDGSIPVLSSNHPLPKEP